MEPAQWLAQARRTLLSRFDPVQGGILTGNNTKFPHEPILAMLLADYLMDRNPVVLDRLTTTLDAMAYGGIYDHLAGGFHRYSTEPTWSVPHFEKMLYNNAQLLKIYATAYQATLNPLYRKVALSLGTYLSREMMSPQGGFFTAQDAEVDGVEGKSYLWSRREIEPVLGAENARRFFQVYELAPVSHGPAQRSGNEVSGQDDGVVRVRRSATKISPQTRSGQVVEKLSGLDPMRRELLKARHGRPQPVRDDKIIGSLNGLAIQALAKAGLVLQKSEYLGWARRAAERIWKLAFHAPTGELKHEIFQGKAQTRGFLEDYALLGVGYMALYQATKERVWVDRATALADGLIKRFVREDGSLSTTVAEAQLLIAPKDTGDTIYPSSTSATIDLLLSLKAATGRSQYATTVSRIMSHLSYQLQQRPEAWPSSLVALNVHRLGDEKHTQERIGSGKYRIPTTADHVRVTAVRRGTSEADEIAVTLHISEGYHANANPATFKYLVPTSVSLDGLTPTQTLYPEPVVFQPKFAPQGLNVYEDRATIVVSFPPGTFEEAQAKNVTVTAQACDKETCLPPAKLRVSIREAGR